MTRSILLVTIAGALVAVAGDVAGQDSQSANIIVNLPSDARLFIDGKPTQQTGASRTFVTPPLSNSGDHSYELQADVDRDGQTLSRTLPVQVHAGETSRVDFGTPGTSQEESSANQLDALGDIWPRKITADGYTVTIYQPQVDKWQGDRLEARAAVAVQAGASSRPTYGVAWLTARTDVDKEHRIVTLEDLTVTRVDFPSAPAQAQEYERLVREALPQGPQTISLDRLEADLSVGRIEAKKKHEPLKNDPPRIITSHKPALLVLVDGQPALRDSGEIKLLRVINTRALLLFDELANRYYLHLLNGWMQSRSLDGPWTVADDPPLALERVLEKLADDPHVDLLDNVAEDLKEDVENGILPIVLVSTVPTELIVIKGDADLAPIDDTKLLWIKNTASDLFANTVDQDYYVLLSGRWFRSKSLTNGSWEFVASDQLSADFSHIPDSHPRADVLASVAGTPQADEAAIANDVPQTASVSRGEASLDVQYDGAPQFDPIAGTSLAYAVNSPTPVIQVSPDSYYACENGIWFDADDPNGPWAAATVVPAVIYTIPTSSPLYYVTYVFVYGYTPDYVFTGYTPGYLGTCLDPLGMVVFWTGWNFPGWIGHHWFGRPWTYGWHARIGWTPGGWGLGFASGCGWPWWGPVGWYGAGGRAWWRAGWTRGWAGPYSGVNVNYINFNNFNVYNRWGNNVVVNTTRVNVNRNINNLTRNFNVTRNMNNVIRNANVTRNITNARRTVNNRATVNASRVNAIRSTNVAAEPGLHNVLAGRDGRVYAHEGTGWSVFTPRGWERFEPSRLPVDQRLRAEETLHELQRSWAARQLGAERYRAFRAAALNQAWRPAIAGWHAAAVGPAGFHPGFGGFRGVAMRPVGGFVRRR